jgi:hypothetical protein
MGAYRLAYRIQKAITTGLTIIRGHWQPFRHTIIGDVVATAMTLSMIASVFLLSALIIALTIDWFEYEFPSNRTREILQTCHRGVCQTNQ